MGKSKVADLRNAYPQLAPDKDYPPPLAVGRSVAEAFNNAYRLERACRTQLLAQACSDEVLLPSKEIFEKTARMYQPGVRRTMGLLEWPAMRRLADRLDPSYKN